MRSTLVLLLSLMLLALQTGCSSLAPPPADGKPSPCATSEASMECQVERYHNVNVE
ncbi:MAG: hypothetical protein KIS62_13820 [Ramlibacter sp.]|nr:hypothetical protein [Ramlibacter sp.]MCW5650819.1 hypothetical protein [Ramlibacter sp.]